MAHDKKKLIEHMDRDAHAFGLPAYSELLETVHGFTNKEESRDDYDTKCAEARAEFDQHPARIDYLKRIMQSLNEGTPAGQAYYAYIAEAAAAERAARVSINQKYGVFLA